MFIKNSFADEIARGMAERLDQDLASQATHREDRLLKAADYLNSVAEIFDELGLYSAAEAATRLLEKTADDKMMETHEQGAPKEKGKLKTSPTGQKTREMNAADDWEDENDSNCAHCGSDKNRSDDEPDDMYHIDDPELRDIMHEINEPERHRRDLFDDSDLVLDDNSELDQEF